MQTPKKARSIERDSKIFIPLNNDADFKQK
jgi:hypothetical protein